MSISYVVLILGGLALAALGWFLNHFIVSNKSKDWKVRSLELEKENKGLTKQLKKEKNQVEQLRQKADGWKQEFHALTQDAQQAKKSHKEKLVSVEDQVGKLRSELTAMKSQYDRSETTKQKVQNELEKLKAKYAKDVTAGENWRSERQNLERELKSVTDRLEKSTVIANEYRGKYDKQALEINNIRVMEREMRMLKTKLSKAEKDTAYWEKKHYETHHELAELKKTSEQMVGKYHDLEEMRKGDEILRSNLMEQISEFKSKFVTVNNKYRDLVSGSSSQGS